MEAVVPVRLVARRVNARMEAMVGVCGVESVGCNTDQDVAFIDLGLFRGPVATASQSHVHNNQLVLRANPEPLPRSATTFLVQTSTICHTNLGTSFGVTPRLHIVKSGHLHTKVML